MCAYSFTLTGDPITAPEYAVLEPDLRSLGLGPEVRDVWNATLQAHSAASVPLILRAYRDGALRGIAGIIECRRPSGALFDGLAATVMDRLGPPQFYWCRVGNLVDASSNVGFVAKGESRDEFVGAALRELMKRYLSGTVIEPGPCVAGAGYVATPLFDHGNLDVPGAGLVEAWTTQHRNLRRKIAKFRNKGGTVQVVRGPLRPEDLAGIMRCLASLRTWLQVPFQDIYGAMVAQASRLDSADIIHILVRLDDAVAGYHSFAESPTTLHALSGAFDRNRLSNYHAYENMIIETARYCAEHGKTRVEFGPVLNDTKKTMMTSFTQSHLRVYSRLAPFRWTLPFVLRRSKLAPSRLSAFVGISGAGAATEDDVS